MPEKDDVDRMLDAADEFLRERDNGGLEGMPGEAPLRRRMSSKPLGPPAGKYSPGHPGRIQSRGELAEEEAALRARAQNQGRNLTDADVVALSQAFVAALRLAPNIPVRAPSHCAPPFRARAIDVSNGVAVDALGSAGVVLDHNAGAGSTNNLVLSFRIPYNHMGMLRGFGLEAIWVPTDAGGAGGANTSTPFLVIRSRIRVNGLVPADPRAVRPGGTSLASEFASQTSLGHINLSPYNAMLPREGTPLPGSGAGKVGTLVEVLADNTGAIPDLGLSGTEAAGEVVVWARVTGFYWPIETRGTGNISDTLVNG